MERTFSFAGAPVERTLTIKSLRDAKGRRKLVQTTANTAAEAAAAEAAGIEMIVGPAALLAEFRKGAPRTFVTVGVHMWQFATRDDIMREAYRLLEAGADAIYCPREPAIVEMLASAQVPVMGHLGLVPRTSTWTGGIRAIGKTPDEAVTLFRAFKDLENAGAVMVEAEVVAADTLTEIAKRTSLSVISLGSGPGGDIDYLFQSDICGETETRPRHARAFADLYSMQKAVDAERLKALKAYRQAVQEGSFPGEGEIIAVRDRAAIVDALDGLGGHHSDQ